MNTPSSKKRKLYQTSRVDGTVEVCEGQAEFDAAVVRIAGHLGASQREVALALDGGATLTTLSFIYECKREDEELDASPDLHPHQDNFLEQMRRAEGMPHDQETLQNELFGKFVEHGAEVVDLPYEPGLGKAGAYREEKNLRFAEHYGGNASHMQQSDQGPTMSTLTIAAIKTALQFHGIAANPHDCDLCSDGSVYHGLTQILPKGSITQ